MKIHNFVTKYTDFHGKTLKKAKNCCAIILLINHFEPFENDLKSSCKIIVISIDEMPHKMYNGV